LFFGAVFGLHYLLFPLADTQGLFNVRDIAVVGNTAARTKEIIRASGIQWGEPIFELDLDEAARGVMTHPLVTYAVVMRLPPSGIQIRVVEKSPVALVNDGSKTYVCDGNGSVMDISQPAGLVLFTVDYRLEVRQGVIADDIVRASLANLESYFRRAEIANIVIKKKEGSYIVLKSLPGTLFYIGKRMIETDYLERVFSIADTIVAKGLSFTYVDVNDTSGIGFH
jgi:cell division septal protein FtsQ